MQLINHMRLEFDARPENESFARIAVSAFTVPFNPTLDVLSDIRTAISEAVTNAIVHAYQERGGTIALDAGLREDGRLLLSVRDWGCGIADIQRAMEPFFTTQPEKERSGMGFAVMQSFMPMRLAGTWQQYSKKAIAQLNAMTPIKGQLLLTPVCWSFR